MRRRGQGFEQTRTSARFLSRKGQGSPEFVIILAGVLIILITVFAIYSGMEQAANASKKRLDAERVATKLANSVSYVEQQGPGAIFYVYNFGDPDFNVSISGRQVFVNYSNTYETAPMSTNRTSVNFNGSALIPMNTYVKLNYSNGIIYVTQG